jgi:hypothetical protein
MTRLAIALLLLAGCSRRVQEPAAATYIDARACAACHPAIAKAYAQTGMGRSFYAPGAQPHIEDWSKNNRIYHAPSRRHYRMIRRGEKLLQQRYQTDAQKREIHLLEREIHYIVGSGNHARTYLHRSDNG